MDVSFNTHDVAIVVAYKSGQTNILDKFISSEDAEHDEKLISVLDKLNQQQNYYPKKIQVIKAVLFIEE